MSDTITIRLSDDLKTEIEKLSSMEKISLSDLVRESLRRYVAVCRYRQLRKRVMPFAEAEGLLTDEDVFKKLKS